MNLPSFLLLTLTLTLIHPTASEEYQPKKLGATWRLISSFAPTPSDHQKDNGKTLLENFWTINHDDATGGFPGAYGPTTYGGPNLFVDAQGNLVLQPTCPTHLSGGDCKAVQCGELMTNGKSCVCDETVLKNKYFPWWCQLSWGSAKIISKQSFSLPSDPNQGGLFVFEDVWIPKGKPLWPAIWLLPVTEPAFGGTGTPKGGSWSSWPNNGELDILETIGDDPRIFGTIHYQCGNEYTGWPGLPVTTNGAAQRGTAYNGPTPLTGNILATRSTGNNPLPSNGYLGTLCLLWTVDPSKGPTFTWYLANGNPITPDGRFIFTQQLDVMVNRVGTNSISGISGDGSGTISFETTPFWPGSVGNSPPLTLYKGWDGKESYGFQGYYPIQGNVIQSLDGIHNGAVSAENPKGLGIVPKFDSNGKMINGTIDHLYEPLLCSMIGEWGNSVPLPWAPTPCQNPPSGFSASNCPRTGTGPQGTYNWCMVQGAKRPSVGWWSNSPLARGVNWAPFSPNQNWNIVLNVAIGGEWPRSAGQEGGWQQNFEDMRNVNLKMKSVSYYKLQ